MFNICSHLSQSLSPVFPQMTRSARFREVETGPIKIRAIQAPSPVARGFQSADPRACLIVIVGNSCAIDPPGSWGGRMGCVCVCVGVWGFLDAHRPPTDHVRGARSSDDLCSAGSRPLSYGVPIASMSVQTLRTLIIRVMQKHTKLKS